MDLGFLNIKVQASKSKAAQDREELAQQVAEIDDIRRNGSHLRRRRNMPTGLFGLFVLLMVAVVFCGFGGLLANYYGFEFSQLSSPIQYPTRQPQQLPTQGLPQGGYATPVVNDPNSFATQLPQPTPFPTMMVPVPTEIVSAPPGTVANIDPSWPLNPLTLSNASNNPTLVGNIDWATIPVYNGSVVASPTQISCLGAAFFYVPMQAGKETTLKVYAIATDINGVTIQAPYSLPGNFAIRCVYPVSLVLFAQ